MGLKEEYQKELQEQLDEWGKEIDKLKGVADKAKAGLQQEYYKEIADLREKKKAAQEKLDELKSSSEEAWEDLKGGIEISWNAMSNAVKSAISRFK
jgi:uncharacterized coiled-coil DUF342 family protein